MTWSTYRCCRVSENALRQARGVLRREGTPRRRVNSTSEMKKTEKDLKKRQKASRVLFFSFNFYDSKPQNQMGP